MSKEFYITSDQSGRRIDRLLRNMWPQIPLGALTESYPYRRSPAGCKKSQSGYTGR